MMKRRFVVFTITSVLLLTSFAMLPVAGIISGKEYTENPWTPEDEGDHFPCGREWWTFYVVLELEDGAHWDVLIQFEYGTQPTNRSDLSGFFLLLYCFDRESGKMHDFTMIENKGTTGGKEIPFYFKKNMIDLKYRNCTMKGLYPNYSTHVENDEKTFILDLSLNATSLPHWSAQEGSNGYFPWGLAGWARYGHIPRLNASGNITIEGKESRVTGIGYFEHAWGNFTYGLSKKTLLNLKEFIRKLQKTLPAVRWCFSEKSINFPRTLMFTRDNFFGYDWAWAAFDNGWSVQFGIFHMLDCVAEGPVFGALSLTPDGETYWDFADITVKYGRRLYIPEADAYLPLDIEITAKKGGKTLHLRFNTTTEPYLGGGVYPHSRFSCGTGGIQTAGVVEGYYQDEEQNIISLHGICTIAPWRQYLITKHNMLKIEFLRPPDGRGFSVKLVSHRLGLELFFKRQWRPYLERQFYIKRIHDTPIVVEPEPPPDNPDASCLYVGGAGPNNYSKIQDAVDNASIGDTVFVYNGTYYENVLVDKTISLVGEDKNKVLVNAGSSDGIRVIADNVEITGFTIDSEKANSYDDSAIDLSSSGNFVHDNIITKSEWYGIYIYNSSYNVVENNSIVDNDIGIWLCRATNNIIRYNRITLSKWVGIWLWYSSRNNVIHYNNFIENGNITAEEVNVRNSDKRCENQWDRNYWDDYVGLKFKRLVDFNNDGVGSIPYRISRFESDRHPMMEPYEI